MFDKIQMILMMKMSISNYGLSRLKYVRLQNITNCQDPIVVASDTRFVFIPVTPDLLPANYLNIQKFLSWLLITVFYSHKFDCTDTELCSFFYWVTFHWLTVIVYQEQAIYLICKESRCLYLLINQSCNQLTSI